MVSWSSSSCSMRPIEVRLSSSAVRSCITRCARPESFHRSGSSACRLSSARRARALSKSKMPPQQPDRLLDLVDNGRDFRAHDPVRMTIPCRERNVPAIRRQGDGMQDRLIGTWRLVSVVNEDAMTGETSDLFGPDPKGYISYGADGRMMVVQVRSDRPRPAGDIASPQEAEALFRSMLSYAGRYTIDGRLSTTSTLHGTKAGAGRGRRARSASTATACIWRSRLRRIRSTAA